ncbi:MAG TPA: NB-ARC domain-containing protein, partial [Pyrinomonadaceae bacterium]|nr:NB-ARC domain-containing protein [Pyrinomonadaceae bacterium]
ALLPLVATALPISSAPARIGNLSDPGPPMIGRENEAAEISDILKRDDARLITLTGIGGTGKTRLAQQVGRQMKQDFADGVFFVDLTAVIDPVLAVPTIAHTLEVPEAGPRMISDALTEHLRDRSTLLILDNFEQIIAAGPEIGQLLRAASGLKILVTSREPLKLTVETEYPVPPLSLPKSGESISMEELEQFEAVKLFVQRAGRARPDFALTVDNAAAVSEICRRLDGIPLAIELAAARTKILSTNAILEKLENRLDVLTGGSKDLPARQQTMRGAIEWSYDLLTDDERAIFRKLSVFAGGFMYSTAEAVIAKTAGSSTAGFLDLVTSITEKGLIIPQMHSRETPRFRMLDIVRAYALEMLNASEEAGAMHLAHAEYYLEFGLQAEPNLKTVDAAKWLSRMEQEHDNLRAAIHWSVENKPEIAAQLAAAIRSLWTVHGHLNEGSRLSAKILSSGGEMSDNVRWKILTAYGNMSQFRGNLAKAQVLYGEGLTVARRGSNQAQISQSLRGLGAVAYLQDDLVSARKFINEALDISRSSNDRFGISASLGRLGDITYCEGNYRESRDYSVEALDIFRDLGYPEGICSKLSTLGAAAFALGDYETAQTSFEEALKVALSLDEKINIRHIMSGFAGLATQREDFTRAARLDGVAEGLGASIEYAIEPAESRFRNAYLVKLKSALSRSLFEKEYTAGRSMSLDEAKTLALDAGKSGDGRSDTQVSASEKPLSIDVETNTARPLLNLKTILIAGIVILLAAAAIWYFAFGTKKQIGSIAVMPFVNESGDPEAEYLSDGITETLISKLSQLPNLKVKSRSSVFRYKGKETDSQTLEP